MSKSTRARTYVIAAAAVIGLTTCCSAAEAAVPSHAQQAAVRLPARVPTPLPTVGQPSPADTSPDLQATVNSLHRDSSGLVTLTWTLKNSGSDSFYPNEHFSSSLKYDGASASDITLTDEAAQLRYNPLKMTPSLTCTCTDLNAVPAPVDNTTTVIFYSTFKVPDNLGQVTVNIPTFSPLKNVKIS